jgi:hypothetical protein
MGRDHRYQVVSQAFNIDCFGERSGNNSDPTAKHFILHGDDVRLFKVFELLDNLLQLAERDWTTGGLENCSVSVHI